MAHMSPVMWLYLFFLFIMVFLMFLVCNHSSYCVFAPKLFTLSSSMSTKFVYSMLLGVKFYKWKFLW